jgi:uncharacterized protein YyaL (SSP411 family)
MSQMRRFVALNFVFVLSFTLVISSVAIGEKGGSPAGPTQEEGNMKAATEPKHTNRLIHATSPYLLQHARNPVDWYEWGDEALGKARKEDKPIFLSIGYSACHWCHVMEHESFEDEEVAALLDEHFVSIKVDREERPDIDEIYMAYTQATTGGGGWPMSVWLKPDGVPFYAGTYFPKSALINILKQISEEWQSNREAFNERDGAVRRFFDQWSSGLPLAEAVIPKGTVEEAAKLVARYFDRTHGGTSGSGTNKFPPSMTMELMLRAYRRTGNEDLLEAVRITLDHMARGGIYDHLGGGICRYSTDIEWLVPHFEKMLYDQALVSSIYLDAYQLTKEPLYAYIASDIFNYVMNDLQSSRGGFYSTRDADSDGLEGAYYIWTVEEVVEILGEEEAELFCAYYDVSKNGNWFESRGHAPAGPKNILHIAKPPDLFAKAHGLHVDDLSRRIKQCREKMLTARAKRVEPGLDDKILTGWNGLMIASLAKGARVLDDPRYAESAARAADFVLNELRRDGRLLRTHRNGESRLNGYLSDYAFFIDGLLYLYEASFDRRWLDEAAELNETLIHHYWDAKGGAFFFTAADAEQLLTRSKNPRDGAIPSGNSVQAMNLLRLAILLDRKDYRQKAEGLFRAFAANVEQSPAAFEKLLCAVDHYHDQVKEIAIVGDPGADDTKALIRTVYDRFLPNKVVVHAAEKDAKSNDLPLLKGKVPVTAPDALARQLDHR